MLKVEPLPDGSGHFFNLSNALFLELLAVNLEDYLLFDDKIYDHL